MSLPSTNLQKTKEFYSILLSSLPTKEKSDYLKFDSSPIPINISFHLSKEVGYNNQHLGIQLSSRAEIENTYQRLLEAGIVSQKKEEGTCCYARQDKFWVTDPDGFRWEIYLLLEDAAKSKSQKNGCCA